MSRPHQGPACACPACGVGLIPAAPEPLPVRPVPGYVLAPAPAPRPTPTGGWFDHFLGLLVSALIGVTSGYALLIGLGGPQHDPLGVRRLWTAAPSTAANADEAPPFEVVVGEAPASTPDAPPFSDSVASTAAPNPNQAEAPFADAPVFNPEPVDASSAAPPFEFRLGGARRDDAVRPVAGELPLDQPAPPFDPGPLPSLAPVGSLAPPAGALRPDEEPLGPRWARLGTAADLEARFHDTVASLTCRHCGGAGTLPAGPRATAMRPASLSGQDDGHVTCPHCDGRPGARLTSEHYVQLCALAEAATFVRAEPTEEFWALRSRLLRFLQGLGVASDRLDALGRMAGYRIASPPTDGDGIILAGTIDRVEQHGPLYVTRVVLFGQPRTVSIYSPRPSDPPLRPRDRVLVLGVIVTDPARRLSGYLGNEPVVIWGGLPIPLPRP